MPVQDSQSASVASSVKTFIHNNVPVCSNTAIIAVEPRFLLDGVPMNGLVGDDSIFHATLWMVFVLVIGAFLLMLAFMLITRCARWCSRSMGHRVESRSNTWPQI